MPNKELKEKTIEDIRTFIKEADPKTFVSHGFFFAEGYILFRCMGQFQKFPELSVHHEDYFWARTREQLVQSLDALMKILRWNPIALFTGPFSWMADMIQPMYDILSHWVYNTKTGATDWMPVPMELRILFMVSIPSMQYLAMEAIKEILELG